MKVEVLPKRGGVVVRSARCGRIADGVYVVYVEFEKPKRFFATLGEGHDPKGPLVSVWVFSEEDNASAFIDIRPETNEEEEEFERGFWSFMDTGRHALAVVMVRWDKFTGAIGAKDRSASFSSTT